MRVNIYAEEMTDRIEIVEKEIDGNVFTALRFYLYMPTSYYVSPMGNLHPVSGGQKPDGELKGPFIHRKDDDDSSAVTFWGKNDLRKLLQKAIEELDRHYENKKTCS